MSEGRVDMILMFDKIIIHFLPYKYSMGEQGRRVGGNIKEVLEIFRAHKKKLNGAFQKVDKIISNNQIKEFTRIHSQPYSRFKM